VIRAFTGLLSGAMEVFIGCQSYHTPKVNSTEFTFSGIAANTGMAFEMCFTFISYWEMRKQERSTRHNSCVGVAKGLEELAKMEEVSRKREHGMQLIVSSNRITEEYLATQ